MDIIRVMESFANWLTRKFREWEKQKGGHQTISGFARHLGVKQPTLTRWMQGDTTPDTDNLLILEKTFGLDVYDALDMDRPEREIPWHRLPVSMRGPLSKAFGEWTEAVNVMNLDPESDEAIRLADKIFGRHGLTVTPTEAEKPG